MNGSSGNNRSKEIDEKIESLKKTLSSVLENAIKHLESGDIRLLNMSDLQLLAGITAVMYEEKILSDNGISVVKVDNPEQVAQMKEHIKEQMKKTAENDFDRPEMNEFIDEDKKPTYH